jgi:hypothetical protein
MSAGDRLLYYSTGPPVASPVFPLRLSAELACSEWMSPLNTLLATLCVPCKPRSFRGRNLLVVGVIPAL